MKKMPILAGALLALMANPGFSLTAQQEKMKTCNADAKTQGLKGDERKAFMKNCLSKKPAGTPPAAATSAPATATPASPPTPAAPAAPKAP